jgi:hypothetical protein
MKNLLLTLTLAVLTAMVASADLTPAPVITIENVGNHNVYPLGTYYQEICVFDYQVTATGEGDVHLYLNGVEVPNPCTIPQDYTDWHDDTWYENEVMYCFSASAQAEGCEMNSASVEYIVPGIPFFTLSFNEETESYWMSFPNGARYRFGQYGSEWQIFSQPFKVWQAPQNLSWGIYIEVMSNENNPSNLYGGLSSNMGILHDLSLHIGNGIFRYSEYIDGIYYPYDFVYYDTPETPFVTLYNSMCNKYWEPEKHPACYAGDMELPGIEHIFDHTFYNCSELTSVSIPSTVTDIGEEAFYGCTGLERVEIPNLEAWCHINFADPTSNPLYYADHLYWSEMDMELTDLEIFSSGMEEEMYSYFYINAYAFAGFKGLKRIISEWRNITPPAEYDAFYGLYDQVPLYVPAEAIENYRADEEWGRFTHIVPFVGAGPGDVNGDYSIDVDDVTDIIGLILDGAVPEYADVNGDGSADIDDITVIINMLLNGQW